jgi:hypothetical protein
LTAVSMGSCEDVIIAVGWFYLLSEEEKKE